MQCSRVVCCRSLKDQRIIEHSSERPLGMNSKWAERWCCLNNSRSKESHQCATGPVYRIHCDASSTVFSDCFTAPTFNAFSALVAGFIARPTSRTVCGMLTGAGLSRFWHHSRTHRFFSASRWSAHQVGLTLAGLVVRHLIGQGEPIPVALDETLLRRRGAKVHAIGWRHDGSAAARSRIGLGNCADLMVMPIRGVDRLLGRGSASVGSAQPMRRVRVCRGRPAACRTGGSGRASCPAG
jgi:hypothetical protein